MIYLRIVDGPHFSDFFVGMYVFIFSRLSDPMALHPYTVLGFESFTSRATKKRCKTRAFHPSKNMQLIYNDVLTHLIIYNARR